jgi:hypothetical protein
MKKKSVISQHDKKSFTLELKEIPTFSPPVALTLVPKGKFFHISFKFLS